MNTQVTGLWGNAQGMFRAAAQSVTETVEEGVRDVSSLHAVKAASGCCCCDVHTCHIRFLWPLRARCQPEIAGVCNILASILKP